MYMTTVNPCGKWFLHQTTITYSHSSDQWDLTWSIPKLSRISNVYSFFWNKTFPLVMTSLKRSRTKSEILEDWNGVAIRGKEIAYFITFKGLFCLKVWLRLSVLCFFPSLSLSQELNQVSFLSLPVIGEIAS